jgi:hypothetical protein
MHRGNQALYPFVARHEAAIGEKDCFTDGKNRMHFEAVNRMDQKRKGKRGCKLKKTFVSMNYLLR